jgi:hypothetical protein
MYDSQTGIYGLQQSALCRTATSKKLWCWAVDGGVSPFSTAAKFVTAFFLP